MTSFDSTRAMFDELHACVIIPTYNNAASLAAVIRDVSQYSDHIIVVNDGSTDETSKIVEAFPYVQYISYSPNVGKGWALRQAFKYALEQDYHFAITIDSDGQHFAKDLPAFVERLQTVQDAIIIGARNMEQSSVPGGSSFGYKFSNFWFKVETGKNCPDTQSGYRAYPLLLLKGMNFYTRKYEFEIEVLVRAVWKGVKADSIPVTVYYPPKEERVSHFRPYTDFTRVGILNSFLVIIALLYIKPRDFVRTIFDKKKLKQILRDQFANPEHTDALKAISIGFGIFMGIIPIWGFQLVTAIFLAVLFRLNKALVIIAANISIPPMIPLIIFLSYKMGAWWMPKKATSLVFDKDITLEAIRNNLGQYIYGSISLAIVAGLAATILTFVLLKSFKRKSILAG